MRVFFIVCMLFVFALPVAASEATRPEAEEYLADFILRKTVKPPAPITAPRLHEKALEYVSNREFDKAAKLYEEIVLIDPNDDQAYLILGHIHLLNAEFDKAEAAFTNAVDIDTQNMNEITPFYENMILRDPDDDKARTYLGYAYLILGEYLSAQAAFKDALELNPANGLARQGLGYIQSRAGGASQ